MALLNQEWKTNHSYSNWSASLLNPNNTADLNVIALSEHISPQPIVAAQLARLVLVRLSHILNELGIGKVLRYDGAEDGFISRGWAAPVNPWEKKDDSKYNDSQLSFEFVEAYDYRLSDGLRTTLQENRFDPYSTCIFCPNSQFTHYYHDSDIIEYDGDTLSSETELDKLMKIHEARDNGRMDSRLPFLSHLVGTDAHVFSPGAIDLVVFDDVKFKALLCLLQYGKFEPEDNSTKLIGGNLLKWYAYSVADQKAFTSSYTFQENYGPPLPVESLLNEVFMTPDSSPNKPTNVQNFTKHIKSIDVFQSYYHAMWDVIKDFPEAIPYNIVHIENRMDVIYPGLGDVLDFKSLQENADIVRVGTYKSYPTIGTFSDVYCWHDTNMETIHAGVPDIG